MSTPIESDPVRILLVEDESFLREALAETLQAAGYEVIAAADGESGFAALRSSAPIDVLVSDIRLPYMSGYELAAAGKAERPTLKLILMTGYAPSVPAGLEKMVFRILQKPFRIQELPAVIDAALAHAPASA